MILNDLFFPLLSRRTSYSAKRDGGYFSYGHYREEVSEDCRHRCVYCDILVNECGGAESMHLDHFRPHSHFPALIDDPYNLVLACPGCNRLKSDNWPASGSADSFIGDEGFIDPFAMDRLEFLCVEGNGQITGLRPPANYQIALLQLNRQSRRLIRLRRQTEFQLVAKLTADADHLEVLVGSHPDWKAQHRDELRAIACDLRACAKALVDWLAYD